MKSNLFKICIYHLLLTTLTLVLLLLPLGTGTFFGSEGDWYSQHVGIAESLRQTMLETHSLIPQYIHLGGGSNIYDFAYYGLLRPDILFSCLVPDIEMKYIIAGYAVLGVIASVNLCYIWLKQQKILKGFAFAGAVLLGSATCFYHAHHQIMFVNYMPYLFLSLIGISRLLKKGRIGFFTHSLFLIYIHSFYYAPACLCVVGIYAVYQILQQRTLQEKIREREWKQMIKMLGRLVGKLMLAIVISIGMALVLLLPTGLDILSNEKDAGSFVTAPVKAADLSLNGLLYSPYGCGMTLLVLYCILLSITKKRKRFLSVLLMFCVLLPVVSYALNGFLYSRAKILIPFVTLFVLITTDTLQEIYQGKQRHYFILLLACFIPVLYFAWKVLVLVDGIILLIWMMLWRMGEVSKKVRQHTFWIILFIPVLVSLGVNMSDSYLKTICQRLGIGINGAYIMAEDDRQNHFALKEIAEFVEDSRYRFDVLSDRFVNCNLLPAGNISKTAMYSSVTNTDYAKFYYDTMGNPIRLNNRVALAPDKNPCFFYFMGIRYLLTDKENLPVGYKKVRQKGECILAQNENVLPVCYGTAELLGQEDYEKLNFPDTLEALCSKAVVSQTQERKTFMSDVQEETPEDFFAENGEEKILGLSGKKESYTLRLNKFYQGKILIISFHVESNNKKEVIIRINGIKNKLSSESAPYPNNNHDFTYILCSANPIDELKIEAGEGDYTVNNLKIYTLDEKYLHHSDIVMPQVQEQELGNTGSVFQGNITMKKDGYFITSYPYRKGYQVKVDSEPVEAEKVNTAFVGVSNYCRRASD